MTTVKHEPKWIAGLEWAILLAIIALATFLRYWKIGDVPPGFNSDEAVGAVGALQTLREGFQYSYEGQGGGGALGFYFAAAAFYLFGPSIESIRGLAAWAGVVSIFANYWAIRELFRSDGLNRARTIAMISTLGLTVSLWHLAASRIAFAGIGVPFLMLPSVYFLWLGLNRFQSKDDANQVDNLQTLIHSLKPNLNNLSTTWPFLVSGIFLGALMYIYLSGAFAAPLYAAFFISQWLIIWAIQTIKLTNFKNLLGLLNPQPARAYLTTQFWNIGITAITGIILLLPIVFVVLTRPDNEPGVERASQAFFMNPQISQGDPWGLLWRSFVGNFGAYGVSFSWLWGESPNLVGFMPPMIGLSIFAGFIIALIQALRGRAAYLFAWLWFGMLLLPSILSPDAIPHNLRTIGATTPAFIFMGITALTLFDLLVWGQTRLFAPPTQQWATRGIGLLLAIGLLFVYWQVNQTPLNYYFYVYPKTNDAEAAYHVYAVEMAEKINEEDKSTVAFILPRNTAAGDVFRNFTTDFLVDLEQPPAAHHWLIDNEETLAAELTLALQKHDDIKVVEWKTSKHTGADPKGIIPYYLEKYGHFDHTNTYEYFNIHTYHLDVDSPNLVDGEQLTQVTIPFGDTEPLITLMGYGYGSASNPAQVNQPTASSGELMWARLTWQSNDRIADDLKSSLLIYNQAGQLVHQVDKELINNILQVGTQQWESGATEETYFLFNLPPATPPGNYTMQLAIYGDHSGERLPLIGQTKADRLVELGELTITPAVTPVDPNTLPIMLPVEQELLPGLKLVGFETLPGETVRSGQTVGAAVIWQANEMPTQDSESPISDDIQVALTTKSFEGEEEWVISEPVGLAGDNYPTSVWQPGELLRGWLQARVPPTLEPGDYKLRLKFSTVHTPDEALLIMPIGDFKVEGWSRQFEPPTPQIAIDANFANQVTLVGLDMASQQLAPNETLTLQLHWLVEAEFAEDYTAFVQLLGPDGLLYGQRDQTPGDGRYPTTGWVPSEYINDEYIIQLNSNAPAGDYQLGIGLYNPNTGERLALNCEIEHCDMANNLVRLSELSVVASQ